MFHTNKYYNYYKLIYGPYPEAFKMYQIDFPYSETLFLVSPCHYSWVYTSVNTLHILKKPFFSTYELTYRQFFEHAKILKILHSSKERGFLSAEIF